MKRARASGYVLGRAREHSLRYKLIREGWFCVRCVGSAGGLPSSQVKPIDLIAIRRGVVWFIQVSKRQQDISTGEMKELRQVSGRFGAVPVLAYKNRNRWAIQKLR